MSYKCEYCGKEFEKITSLYSHYTHCKFYIKNDKRKSIYKINDNLYRCECGKEFNNHQSLNAHFSHCLIHKEKTGQEIKLNRNSKGKMLGWDKFSDIELSLIHKKSGITLSENIKNGITIPSFLGKHLTDEQKTHLRKIQAKKLKGKNMKMNYSKKSL